MEIKQGQLWERRRLFRKPQIRKVLQISQTILQYWSMEEGEEVVWLHEFERWAEKATVINSGTPKQFRVG